MSIILFDSNLVNDSEFQKTVIYFRFHYSRDFWFDFKFELFFYLSLNSYQFFLRLNSSVSLGSNSVNNFNSICFLILFVFRYLLFIAIIQYRNAIHILSIRGIDRFVRCFGRHWGAKTSAKLFVQNDNKLDFYLALGWAGHFKSLVMTYWLDDGNGFGTIE